MRRALLVAGFVALGCAGSAAPSGHGQGVTPERPQSARGVHDGPRNLDKAFGDLDASRYAEAEAAFRANASGDASRARLGLVRVLLVTGRYAEAATLSSESAGAPPKIALELIELRGEALRRLGRRDEALSLLTNAAGDPDARRIRLLLGEMLLEEGRQKDAEPVLMTLIEQYNRRAIDASDGRSLAMVGRAAELLGSPRDANDAFNEAEQAGASDAETLLWRAELFLTNYDPGHAEEVVSEVLSRSPRNPEGLAWMAEVKLASNLDFDSAEKLARTALEVNPALAHAEFVLAGVALRDMDLAKADTHVATGLRSNPRDLDLLSLHAAIRFLADDHDGFVRAKEDVLKKNPRYSRLYQIVGEYAEWEHRYEEIVSLMREALLADPQDAKVRAELGFNLIRSGEEKEGVGALTRAFSADPFNVRVKNTLDLYEKHVATEYVSVDRGRFTIRYNKDERDVLDRYVPPLLERAFRTFAKKYDFVPATPIGIELYPSREHFAVRTSGLPQTFIQGVCFGKTLAAMSPKVERFNIGMTLWHELAHVFHIQLSKSRVPRWFTEGLAEYETLVARPEWRREYDADLYEAMSRGKIPPLAHMNTAFSHAEDMSDMATAYYASTQVVGYVVERYGMPRIRRMLELWGEGKKTPDVIKEALGASPEEIDQGFRTALGARLARYKTQFMPETRPPEVAAAQAAVAASPRDAAAQARLAFALMGAGEEKSAESALDAALKLEPKQPLGLWLKSQVAAGRGDRAASREALTALLAAGKDGYTVRIALADAAPSASERRSHLEAARGFDPTAAAPLKSLVELAKASHDEDAELDALRALTPIEENNGEAYRRLVEILVSRHAFEEARKAGEAAVYVDVENAGTHLAYAQALVGAGARQDAIFELESALKCDARPDDLIVAHSRLADLLAARGDRAGAMQHRKAAAELGRQQGEKLGPI